MRLEGTTSPDLLLPPLDGPGGRRAQLEAHLRAAVQSGTPAARGPPASSRALAERLGVSRRLVVEAYAQLVAEGYLVGRQGSGTRVKPAPPGAPAAAPATPRAPGAPQSPQRHRPPRPPRFDLFPGTPDLARFPRRAWGAALRAALAELPDHRLGYGHPAGAPELRTALADHLGRVRGAVVPSPEHVVVCAGYAQGLRILLEGLRDGGARRVAVEEPGYGLNALLVAAAGLEPVPVRADRAGLDVVALAAGRADAVVVTPAHGLPLGGVLDPERRAALVAWARAAPGRLVIEDDYDAEFRYDAEPLGTLQGLAPDVVALVGTVSKTLAPALRLGWVVAPGSRAAAAAQNKALHDLGSPLLEQLALARLLSSGGFDRHVRTLRPRLPRAARHGPGRARRAPAPGAGPRGRGGPPRARRAAGGDR
jgi:GntR family transcriptional regulator/MocR family aminotransferase